MPGTVRIAVVEDDRDYQRELVAGLITRPGWQVVARCSDGAAALREIPRLHPDLILFDLNLDGVLRVDVVRELRRMLPGVPLVALTIEDQAAVIVQVIQAGASGYLLKGDSASVRAGVEDVLAGGAPAMSPAVARRLWEAAQVATAPVVNPGSLTEREWQVLQMAARGQQQGEIGAALGIALNTVKNHFRNIYEKLGVGSLTEAMIRLRGDRGLLDG